MISAGIGYAWNVVLMRWGKGDREWDDNPPANG